jgi:hypothetical protein
MDRSPEDRSRHNADELQQSVRQAEGLALEHLRHAREHHRKGIVSDEVLTHTEDLAKSVTRMAISISLAADGIIQRERRHDP